MKRPAVLALVVTLVGLLAVACSGSDPETGETDGPADGGAAVGEPAPEGVDGVLAYDIDDNTHVEGSLEYAQHPPVAGNHNPVWANCGTYDEPVADENAVHSLEHGAVWITWSEDLDEASVAELEAYADGSDHVLVSPYPDLDAPVVLTAWNRQLAVDSASDPRVAAFVETYESGPTTPEPGAACSGGVG